MDEQNVIKFDASARIYKKLADNAFDNNDPELALRYLLEAKEKTRYLLSLYYDIAGVYFSFGMYELSANYWFKFINIAPKYELSDGYNALAACYGNMGNATMAAYYYSEDVKHGNPDNTELDDEKLEEFFEKIDSDFFRPDLRVVYPPECVDYSEQLKSAKLEVMRGNMKKAEELLDEVPEGASEYSDAQLEKSLAALYAGEPDKAIEISKNIYERDHNNIGALCNLTGLYRYRGKETLSRKYFALIDEKNAKTDEELYRIATACCDHGKHERAAKCFKKLLGTRPYDMSLQFLYAAALYNSGEFEGATAAFGRIVRITEVNPVAQYYCKISETAAKSGVKNVKPINYAYKLPEEEIRANLKRLTALLKLKSSKSIAKRLRERETRDMIDWCFTETDKDILRGAVYALCYADTRAATNYLLDKLLDPSISDAIKEYAIEMLMIKGYDKGAGVVVSNVYMRLEFLPLNIDHVRGGSEFNEAYARCYAKAAVSLPLAQTAVYNAGCELFYRFESDDEFIKADTDALAATIFVFSGIKKDITFGAVAKLFDCDKNELTKLLDKIGVEYV